MRRIALLAVLLVALVCVAGPTQPANRHIVMVWFTTPVATNALIELQMATSLARSNFVAVAWYPCTGSNVAFAVSNNVLPTAFFRTRCFFGTVSNLTIYTP
jgi:hypothetical protein